MKVIILCGGKGTRIREATESIPKPMLPIGGRPILWHIMKIYSYFGHNDFILLLGYKAEIIKDFFLRYHAMVQDCTVDLGKPASVQYHGRASAEQWRVTLTDTGMEANTGRRVALAERYLGDDTRFMLTYGDGVSNIDINRLVAFHESQESLVTLTAVRPIGRFGELRLDQDDTKVSRFAEKPQVSEGRINGGFFVMERQFIRRYLDSGENQVLEQEPLRRCAQEGQLRAYCHDGYWQPMDTFREYSLLNSTWDSGSAPWRLWGENGA